jgi:hypothetical protein
MSNFVGYGADQHPLAGQLGTMAFQDHMFPTVGSTLNQATDTTSVRPCLNLDFANSQTVDPRIINTRSTTATFVGANGLIQTSTYNNTRIDFDPTTLACKGVLVEEQRTNLVNYSQSTSGWSNGGGNTCTMAFDTSILAPDGTSTALRITASATSSAQCYMNNSSNSYVANNSYIYSAFVKQGTSRYVGINGGYSASAMTPDSAVMYDFATNTFPLVYSTVTAYGSQIFPGGWVRIWIKYTPTAAMTFDLRLMLANNPSLYSQTAGDYAWVWGMQVEQAGAVSSYIPTAGSATTRSADYCYMLLTSVPNYNPYQATVTTTYVDSFNSSSTATLCSLTTNLSGSGAFNEVGIRYGSSTNMNAYIYSTTATPNYIGDFTITTPNPVKVALAYNTYDFSLAGDGRLLKQQNFGIVPNVNTTTFALIYLVIGNDWPTGNGYYLNGHLKRLTIYPVRLSNAEIIEITK